MKWCAWHESNVHVSSYLSTQFVAGRDTDAKKMY